MFIKSVAGASARDVATSASRLLGAYKTPQQAEAELNVEETLLFGSEKCNRRRNREIGEGCAHREEEGSDVYLEPVQEKLCLDAMRGDLA
jgi:hypothetical protein